ncbi:histidine phosphatase family protein [Aromatoleum diolicum]|uniref:Histidine phosphatase family protein n=1 Tax=Aromatoleum diolicum TaxID=75796 RepID=A0ABX1Q9K9_9RHOO|nr:histidine phosphatase family protein [Aromatoleum diolicum]NMG73706.1 histidine phosphatase family protein [Aromatoleum diolicum]
MNPLPGTRCRRRVYLMRHAEVSYFDAAGHPIDPRYVTLTERGCEQARSAGALLHDVPFDGAVSSGMPRTLHTANLVLDGRPLAIREDPRLKEIRAGRLAAVPSDRRDEIITRAYERAPEPGASFIGGEPWGDFQQRVLGVWRELMQTDTWANLLVVAHDAVNRVILSHVTGASLHGLKAFEQEPACINIIDVDVDEGAIERAFIRAANLTAYNLAAHANHDTVMERISAQFKAG